ncbi:MAG TPA: SpoIID/LytB domain-containing protein [Aldersonia sp.]
MRRIVGRWAGPGRSAGRRKRMVGRPLRRGRRRAMFGFAPAATVGALLVASLGSGGVVLTVDATTPFTIAGTGGAGHGRGMGQWGAYAYAKQGWSADQILAHYYEGAQLGRVGTSVLGVRLMERDDKPFEAYSDAGATVAGHSVEPGQAVRLVPTASGANVAIADRCGGSVIWEGTTDDPYVDPIDNSPDRPASEHLKLCDGTVPYRGSLGVALEGAAPRTVNALDVEDYLRGVVPKEMSPGWADQGGKEALRAQAIAARSYALAEDRYPYAQICNTQSCQVYAGSGVEDKRTDDAVSSTKGTVLMKDGEIMRSEYSASSAVSAGFPGVVETGAGAPPEGWSRTLTAEQIGQAFGVGDLQSAVVTGRDEAGRVTNLHVVGSSGVVDVSGAEAQQKLALDSDAFEISEGGTTATPPGGVTTPTEPAAPQLQTLEPGDLDRAQPATPETPGGSTIDDKYRELGGPQGEFGAPMAPELQLPRNQGKFRAFTNGVIFWAPQTGVQAVDFGQFLDLLGTLG